MKYRNVGATGLKISEISLGAWLTYGGSVAEKKATPIIHAAIEQGVNFIDLADVYTKGEAEIVAGKAIKGMTRSDLVISSKLFWPMTENINDRGLSRKHIMESVEKSLKRLGTDYLDLYFCHRYDEETPIEETVRAMDDLVHQGKILYWGTSWWSAPQIERAVGMANSLNAYRPVVEQPRYNMIDRTLEKEVLPVCKANGIGLVVWSPLAQGLLTGKYNDGIPEGTRAAISDWLKPEMTEESLKLVRKLTELAQSLDIKLSQMALAWILRKPEISCAIIGATTVDQLTENLAASDIELSEESLKEIENILD